MKMCCSWLLKYVVIVYFTNVKIKTLKIIVTTKYTKKKLLNTDTNINKTYNK